MKYPKFLAFSALGTLLLASCANEDIAEPKGDGNVTFTLQMPGDLGTRDFGDGTKAKDLYFAVYEHESTTPIIVSEAEYHFTGLTTTVNLKLVNGKNYDIIWWAQSPDVDCYTFKPEEQSVEISYTGIASNDENRDAFFQHTTTGVITAAFSETVKLYRPFAQLNFGTDDLDEPAVTAAFTVVNPETGETSNTLRTQVTTSAYSKLNLLNEEASEEIETQLFGPNSPCTAETFPVPGYDYLNMNYILMTKDQQLNDLTFTVLDAAGKSFNTITIPNVPLQRNYRTNIYGQLLTSTASYEIVIEPDFNKPDYNFSQSWDGTARKPAVIDETNKSMTINDGNELAWLAQQLSNANNEYAEYAVDLNADIDLNGNAWTPIGSKTAYAGKFNGNGHTIKNLTVSGNYYIGLFAKATNGAVIDNVILDNVNLTGTYAGALVGDLTNSTVSNVKVKSGIINGRGTTAGLVGAASGNSTIENCDNAASVSCSGRYSGGIVATINSNSTGVVTVSGCNNTGNIDNTASKSYSGGIVGQSNGIIKDCTNSGKITGNNESLGGVVGEQRNYGSVTGCKNTGNVIKGIPGYGTGGIVGWVRYYYPSSANPRGLISVNDNINEGNITGGNGCGGIVGVFYNYGFCENNKNYAQKISTTGTFVAGIIGNAQFPTDRNNLLPDVPTDNTKLVIKGNVTTTTDITGSCSNPLVYDNSLGKNTEISGNTIPD